MPAVLKLTGYSGSSTRRDKLSKLNFLTHQFAILDRPFPEPSVSERELVHVVRWFYLEPRLSTINTDQIISKFVFIPGSSRGAGNDLQVFVAFKQAFWNRSGDRSIDQDT